MAYQPIESYGLIGDMRTAALVGTNGIDRLALLPALRLAQRLRRHPRRRQRRPVRHRPHRRGVPLQAALLPGHQRPGDPVPRGLRGGRGRRLHAGRSGRREVRTAMRGPHVTQRSRHRAVADAMRSRLRLRPGGPPGRSGRGRCLVSLSHLDLALGCDVPVRDRRTAAVADFSLNEGEEASFVFGESDPESADLRCPPDRQHELLTRRSTTGTSGCRSAPTGDGGARWSIARRSPSSS